ncbi:MAG: cell division protein FtsA [Rikenellaceae bacterium]
MEKRDYIVAIDLGDSNIVVAVGTPAAGGRINIEYILSRPSAGVSAGQIMNIDSAIKTIKGALSDLKDQSGIEVEEAYVGISGEFIYCSSHTDHVFVPDHRNGVTQQVVDALFERMGNVLMAEDRIIMERIPQRYVINDTTEVENPVGVFGSPLSSTFNFISSDNVPLGRIDMALRRLQITPRRTFSNAVVVGDAVLSSDEKEEGVVVVDLGGELTDIAIYYRNVVRYISTIPMGAKTINNDIRTLTIPERYIEPLKLKYGCALSRKAPQDLNVIIKGRTKHDQREIAVYNLAAVIEARVRDIAELVTKEIADSSFEEKVPYGIVLTGGSAQLRYIDELFREVTGMEVRVAEAEDVISPQTRSMITSSADSTVVGLLLHGLKYGACKVKLGEPKFVPKPEVILEKEVTPPEVIPEVEIPVTEGTPQSPVVVTLDAEPAVQPEQRVVPPVVKITESLSVVEPPQRESEEAEREERRKEERSREEQEERRREVAREEEAREEIAKEEEEPQEEPQEEDASAVSNPEGESIAPEAPVSITSNIGEGSATPPTAQEPPIQTKREKRPSGEPKPGSRFGDIFNKLAKGATTWVNKMNTIIDVDEEV